MANPQNDKNGEIGPERQPNARPRLRSDAYGWRWFAFFWIFLVVVGVFVVWFIGFGWGAWGGWLHGGSTHEASAATANPLASAVLTRDQKASYVGEKFYFRNVPVQQVVDPFVLWVGPNNRQPTLLILTGSTYDATHHAISPGDRISVTGVVKKAPNADAARQNWHLTDQGAQQLERQQAYLQGISLSLGAPAQKNG